MADVAERSGRAGDVQAGSQPFAGLPPQDGHYHFDNKAGGTGDVALGGQQKAGVCGLP